MTETLKLGTAIKKVRKAKKLSQEEFCKIIGIDRPYLSLIETNNRLPSIEFLSKIAKGLEMPVQILFWLSTSKEDIHEDKRKVYELLKPSLDSILKEFLSDEDVIREIFTQKM